MEILSELEVLRGLVDAGDFGVAEEFIEDCSLPPPGQYDGKDEDVNGRNDDSSTIYDDEDDNDGISGKNNNSSTI